MYGIFIYIYYTKQPFMSVNIPFVPWIHMFRNWVPWDSVIKSTEGLLFPHDGFPWDERYIYGSMDGLFVLPHKSQ